MEPVYRSVIGAGHLLFRGLGLRITVTGADRIPAQGPVVLAANHVSFLDFALVGLAARPSRRYVRFLARYDVWHHPVAAPLMRAMRHIPVDRRAPAAAYLLARAALRRGEAVGIFPEAGVSTSYTVRGMLPGAVALARETGAPLVPVALWGGQRVYTADQPRDLTRGRPVSIRVGAPVLVEPGQDLHDGTRELGRTLQRMLSCLQQLPEHQPVAGERAPWHPAHLGGHAPTARETRAREVLPAWAVPPDDDLLGSVG